MGTVITITERHGDILEMVQHYQKERHATGRGYISASTLLANIVFESPMYKKWKQARQKGTADDEH